MKFGIFICESCAFQHMKAFAPNRHYLKDIWNEHWDPHQLKMLAVSENKPWYDLLKRYNLDKQQITTKYKSAIAKWYKKSVKA